MGSTTIVASNYSSQLDLGLSLIIVPAIKKLYMMEVSRIPREIQNSFEHRGTVLCTS
ncbi:hypothetical protein GYMLUDRAFT_616031 [Collybiopsis luxurians FD-317 M1]|uniref:Uncharacterized protein n=1 Tax=Collybiopsis luxurians FD-317 M1 TaxID=944289 RepID=A0A0D0BJR6_9AGAR|nr:hypothetical protein GYMLUDRAFT_616031 [Collybiopsis luxurians FD-317 M1]